MGKVTKTRILNRKHWLMFSPLVFILLVSPLVLGLTYNDETINADLTSFEWCFNPDLQKDFYKDNFDVYVDNIGDSCDITNTKLYAVIPLEYTQTDYWNETMCILKDDKTQELTINGTYPQIEDCTITQKSKSYSVKEDEWIDTSLTNIFMTKDMKFCYVGQRIAKNGLQSCDMNFKVDMDNDGILEYDVKDDGKAWWNSTFLLHRNVVIDDPTTSSNENFPFPFIFNATELVPEAQLNGSDLRFIYNNVTNLNYDIDVFNNTDESILSLIWVKINLTGDLTSFDLYYDNTSNVIVGENEVGTWDTSYIVARYSMSDDSAGDIGDSTLNNNLCVKASGNSEPDQTTGYLGKAQQFDYLDGVEASDFCTISASASMNAWTNFTWRGWFLLESGGGSSTHRIMNDQSNGLTDVWTVDDSAVKQSYYDGVDYPADTGASYNSWVMFTMTREADGTMNYYFNGTADGSSETGSKATVSTGYQVGKYTGSANNYGWIGKMDELRIYKNTVSSDWVLTEFLLSSNSSSYVTIGDSKQAETPTNLNFGLFDENYNNISLTINENENFRIWANYSYLDNSSSIDNATGQCLYHADNIIDEFKIETDGFNSTICNIASCDYNTLRQITASLPTDNFVQDIYRFELCHLGSETVDLIITNNCSFQETIPASVINPCSSGSTFVSINTQACNGAADVLTNITTTAGAGVNAFVFVNDYFELDREHNHTNPMIWNDTLELWTSDEEHQFFEHGTRNITINCTDGIDVQNQSGLMSVTVVNNPPILSVVNIWDWFNDFQVLQNGTIVKYPLSTPPGIPWVNVTGGCFDDDVDSIAFNLTFNNGTFIRGGVLTNENISGLILFEDMAPQSDFTTDIDFIDGSENYVGSLFCNDTQGAFDHEVFEFTVENSPPTLSFIDNSPLLISTTPRNITWSCSDIEGETTTNRVYVNGSLNKTSTDQWYLFNEPIGTYNVSVMCSDTFYNVTDELIVEFSESCSTQITGICNGCKYDTLTKEVSISCINNVSIDSCWYYVDDFTEKPISNCSIFNVSLFDGWNDLNIKVSSAGFNTTESLNVWAIDYNKSIFDYPIIIIIALVILVFGILGASTKAGFFHLINMPLWILLGYNLVAFSSIMGLSIGILGVFSSLIMITAKM